MQYFWESGTWGHGDWVPEMPQKVSGCGDRCVTPTTCEGNTDWCYHLRHHCDWFQSDQDD